MHANKRFVAVCTLFPTMGLTWQGKAFIGWQVFTNNEMEIEAHERNDTITGSQGGKKSPSKRGAAKFRTT
ncbi:MAG: hypothetical protein P8Y38_07365 [Deltaproteobacteria bacterium]